MEMSGQFHVPATLTSWVEDPLHTEHRIAVICTCPLLTQPNLTKCIPVESNFTKSNLTQHALTETSDTLTNARHEIQILYIKHASELKEAETKQT